MTSTEVTADPAAAAADNPLLAPSPLPYQLPPFDRLQIGHFRPAFEVALAEHRAELTAIAEDPDPPTVDNTLLALERAGETLTRVGSVFNNLASAHTNPEVQEIERELAPTLAAHRDATYLDPRLFRRVRSLYEQRDQLDLDAETAWLLERYHRDFVRAGARLSDEEQQRLREINQELSALHADFRARLLADTNELAVTVAEPSRLAGLSDDAVAAATAAGQERGADGPVLTLILPTSQPSLAALRDRRLREQLHTASVDRGARGNDHDNRELVRRIAVLRAERARLLGYAHHADYQCADRTAGSLAAVDELLGQLVAPGVRNAAAEQRRLQQAVDAEGGGFTLQPWDWPYYAERVREQEYDVDYAAVREYFPLEQVLVDGVLYAASELYGIRFARRHDLPTYHPDVMVFEVFDVDDTPLGLFCGDWFTRESKRGGAWQSTFVSQSHLRGTRPVAVVNMNIPRPPAGEPALLTVDEVKTMFHEFGHVLHTLFSDVRYPRFAGTSVPRDFVEYPSQVNEMWMLHPQVVANYARHYRTGEQLPAETLRRLRRARTFNAGFEVVEYLAAALLDLAWHRLDPQQAEAVADVLAFEARALADAGLAVPAVPPRYRSTYFAHIFSGDAYSAGYYSYIWSEVLDADTVEWFEANGGLRRANGDWFRQRLLSRGGSTDPMVAFRDFRGRDPRIEPLLARRGLTDRPGPTGADDG